MYQFISMWSINNHKWDVKVFYNKIIRVRTAGWHLPPVHQTHLNGFIVKILAVCVSLVSAAVIYFLYVSLFLAVSRKLIRYCRLIKDLRKKSFRISCLIFIISLSVMWCFSISFILNIALLLLSYNYLMSNRRCLQFCAWNLCICLIQGQNYSYHFKLVWHDSDSKINWRVTCMF